MKNPNLSISDVNDVVEAAKSHGIIHLTADDKKMPNRRHVHLGGKKLLNFSSCNYVGLETDDRLKAAAIAAIDKYGVQYYCVRTYLSLQPYEELESLLDEMFGCSTLVMPTTMLAHMSCLPVLIDPKDAIILDHQVHTSVQMTTQVLAAKGTHIEMIRHDRMDYLENRIKKLKDRYQKIWYLNDGVYSMYGNIASYKELDQFLNQYEQFHLYCDDSHGMSWTGKHGTGTAMERMPLHPRMVIVSSMGKAFGASGGVGVFHDEKMRKAVRNCGSPLIFTGPLQPATLGAAVASAKIHLSDEITMLQNTLKKRIKFFIEKSRALGLPILGNGDSPIFYMGCGKPEVGFQLCSTLKDEGFFSCIASFPAVSAQRTGIRFLLTVHHTEEDITLLLEKVAELLPKVLNEAGVTIEKVRKIFGLENPVPENAGT